MMNKQNTNNEPLIEWAEEKNTPIIKIIGVGGGGGNAVAHMYRSGIRDARFLVCNSDSKALDSSPVPDRLQIGAGLGCGGNPEKGREYAEESVEDIKRVLDEKTKMVFITAGMGGGTGTGAAPIIAREAKKKGILTIGIVTTPFLFEREKRIDKALDGVEALAKEVDAILIINNQRLVEIFPNLSVLEGFGKADETLTKAASSIIEIINMHGHIDLDFQDVCTVLRDGGVAVMSSGFASGEGRTTKAIQEALNSPLLNNNDIYEADKIIFCITSPKSGGHELMMDEINELSQFMSEFNEHVETKWGLAYDDSLGEQVKITILASGIRLFGKKVNEVQNKEGVFDDPNKLHTRMFENIYGNIESRRMIRKKNRVFIFSQEDLMNEEIVYNVENKPTFQRSVNDLNNIKSCQ